MSLPLQGIRVIDVSQFAAAPTATALLADWGAEVIHVRFETSKIEFKRWKIPD